MTHAEKVRLMIEDLSRRGVSEWTSAPPIYRLAWKLGLKLTPPLFGSFGSLFVFHGVFFGVLWGIFFNVSAATRQSTLFGFRLAVAAAGGFLFGLIMAIVLRKMARKHQLPAWKDYQGAAEPFSPPPIDPHP